MELLSSKFLISSAQTKCPATLHTIKPPRIKISGNSFLYFRFVIHSRKSSYQVAERIKDLRMSVITIINLHSNFEHWEYANPLRLLPATEAKDFMEASVERAVTSLPSDRPKSQYKVKLQTSKIYGSDLTDVNSGILLCLIDENGSSILQRLPAMMTESESRSEDKDTYDAMHFQSGSVDEFTFEGPDLGRILAVWIGLESGQWRVAGLNLIIVKSRPSSSAEENQETRQLTGLQYSFEFDDILLGDSNDFSMMEFRPRSATAFSADESTLSEKKSTYSFPALDGTLTSNVQSMKEYADLKFSLLFYDAVLILAGSSIASFSTGESTAYAFLTGGFCGFFYLLLLQRSVDELQAPELTQSENKGIFGGLFRKLRGPISSLALAFAFAIIALKYTSGEDSVKLTANELIFGTMGFLMCKVSVVLAAFKPLPLGFRDDKREL